MRTCCAHPTAPIPTYQIRPGTNHKTSYSYIYIYISYIPSNSFIVYLSANPLIHRSAGQSQVALRVARGAANAWWAAANSSLAQQGDPLGSELAIWQSSMIFLDFNRPNIVYLCLSFGATGTILKVSACCVRLHPSHPVYQEWGDSNQLMSVQSSNGSIQQCNQT